MMRWCHTVQGHASASTQQTTIFQIRHWEPPTCAMKCILRQPEVMGWQRLWACEYMLCDEPPTLFFKELYQPTTDEIEMRMCRDEDQDDDVAIESYEIYVHRQTQTY